MEGPSSVEPSGGEAEGCAIVHDVAGGATGEMGADHEHRGRGEAGQHPLAGVPCQGRIGIRGRGPFWPGDLTGMVHEVAGDQRFLAVRDDAHADVTRGMARRWDEADLVADPVIGLDEIDEPGLRTGVTESASTADMSSRSCWPVQCANSMRPMR